MKKILLIDDDELTMASFCEELLNKYHFKVNWIMDAALVIDAIENSKYDAIIMDIMMPVPFELFNNDEKRQSEEGLSTGIVLFKKIREKHLEIPIVIYSAKGFSQPDEFSYYLRKPELSETIVKILLKFFKKN